eukprot:2854431-Amphidinium_carterae.1
MAGSLLQRHLVKVISCWVVLLRADLVASLVCQEVSNLCEGHKDVDGNLTSTIEQIFALKTATATLVKRVGALERVRLLGSPRLHQPSGR